MIRNIQLFDGAAGTNLSAFLKNGAGLVEELNVTDPDAVLALQKAYVDSGADYITTNTFSVNPAKWDSSVCSWQQAADAAIRIARTATLGTGVKVMFDITSTGRLMEPIGQYLFEQAYDNYKELVEFTKSKVDGYILETFSDLYEIKAAVLAVKENSDKPVFATMTFNPDGLTLTGSSPEIVALTLSSLKVDALGANCSSGPEKFVKLVGRMRRFANCPIIVQPNKGLPVMKDGKVEYPYSDSLFAQNAELLARAGAAIIGGCCGTGPSTISAIGFLKREKALEPAPQKGTYICSSTRLAELGKCTVCGERLNPTGKKKLRQALQERDWSYLQNEALAQMQAGADYLDLNVGVPDCNEPELLCCAVKEVQKVCMLPLQLDSSNVAALEQGIRVYNGVPMINSINGSDKVLDRLLPVMQKYGTPAVTLTLNDSGVPETSDGRLDIARYIIGRAASYGISPSKLVCDALVMTVSSDSRHGVVTLETLRGLKELGVLTTIGLSNVSFGLPDRPALNRTFLTLALQAGLDMPIMNPLDRDTMATLKAFRALEGMDADCRDYIAFNTESESQDQIKDLDYAIMHGLSDSVCDYTQEELKSKTPMDVINNVLIPALAKVGDMFEQGKMFLPQLIRSAESAKLAFAFLSDIQKENAENVITGKTVVLATVKGDVHDIGKNIVKVVLQSHGINVIDLGKDVSKETLVECCMKNNPHAVGLSALMTTTVESMKETIAFLRQNGLMCPVIAGGAVLTEQIALNIGATYYAKDALSAVTVVNSLR